MAIETKNLQEYDYVLAVIENMLGGSAPAKARVPFVLLKRLKDKRFDIVKLYSEIVWFYMLRYGQFYFLKKFDVDKDGAARYTLIKNGIIVNFASAWRLNTVCVFLLTNLSDEPGMPVSMKVRHKDRLGILMDFIV